MEILSMIAQFTLIGVTAWYLCETIKQRKNSEKQLEILRKQNELQNTIKVIPDIIVSDFPNNDKMMNLDKEGNNSPDYKIVLNNFSNYDIYNVRVVCFGIFEEGSFFHNGSKIFDFIKKDESVEFPIDSFSISNSFKNIDTPIKELEEDFKQQLKGLIHLRFFGNSIPSEALTNDAFQKIFNLWDKENNTTTKAAVLATFYDKLDNYYLTTRIYDLIYNPDDFGKVMSSNIDRGQHLRTLIWMSIQLPKTDLIYENKKES